MGIKRIEARHESGVPHHGSAGNGGSPAAHEGWFRRRVWPRSKGRIVAMHASSQWQTIDGPIVAHDYDPDGSMWVWVLERADGEIQPFYCGVRGTVGDHSADMAIDALESKGGSEASKASMMRHPPRKVVLGDGGYIDAQCEWGGNERPYGHSGSAGALETTSRPHPWA